MGNDDSVKEGGGVNGVGLDGLPASRLSLGMRKSGNQVIDSLVGGLDNSLLTIYGPPASGKTSIAIEVSAEMAMHGEVVFIDTEGGFSGERLRQICEGKNISLSVADNITILSPTSLVEQASILEKLSRAPLKGVSLVVLDSAATLYRLERDKRGIAVVNREFAAQIDALVRIARTKAPVILTNQVYKDFEEEGVYRMVGGDIIAYRSKYMIELLRINDSRIARLVKHKYRPSGISVKYRIVDEGVVISD